MRVTEAQAKQKWCRFVRVDGDNRLMNMRTSGFDDEHMFHHCIDSQWMAWRQFHISYGRNIETDFEHHGYCGLAGHPEVS